jgi:hypothetical protein
VFIILAVSSKVQLGGAGSEKIKPGSEGTTTLNDIFFPVGLLHDSVKGLITGRNSWKEPVFLLKTTGVNSGGHKLTWPSMEQNHGNCIWVCGFFVYEMNVQSFYDGSELLESVHQALEVT